MAEKTKSRKKKKKVGAVSVEIWGFCRSNGNHIFISF